MTRTEIAEVGGIRLARQIWSSGHPSHPPVVLLPALGETAADWDLIAAELSRDRHVHAVDLRGHGGSDWPGEYSLSLMSADVVALLRQFREPPDVVGHSLGGLVACLAVAHAPDAVRRLVLEDVPLPHPRQPAMPPRPPGRLDFDWRVVEQVRPELDSPDPAWASVIRRIRTPTLVLAGGPSSTIPQDDVAELARTLADASLVTVDAGHLVHATKPAEFLRHLIDFLA